MRVFSVVNLEGFFKVHKWRRSDRESRKEEGDRWGKQEWRRGGEGAVEEKGGNGKGGGAERKEREG